jgi:hypothetical protein
MKCIICGNEAVAIFPRVGYVKAGIVTNYQINYAIGVCKKHLDAAMKVYDADAEPKILDAFVKAIGEVEA